MRPIRFSFIWLLLLTFLVPALRAADADPVAEQATWIIQRATIARPVQHILLRALRQLRDPQLEPLFSDMAQQTNPEIKIQGILALAEISPSAHVDLAQIAALKSPATQTQLVSAALDSNLLSLDDAAQLLTWQGIEPQVKVIIAARLAGEDRPVDPKVLEPALASSNAALKGMAALVCLQLGQSEQLKTLYELDKPDLPNRDAIRSMLLQAAIQNNYKAAIPWTIHLLDLPDLDHELQILALRAALHLDAPSARDRFAAQYEAAVATAQFSDDPLVRADAAVTRMRLLVLSLDLADHLSPQTFQPLIQDSDPVTQTVGVAGQSLAHAKPDTQSLLKLIDFNNRLISTWVLQYAVHLEDRGAARPLLVRLIEASQTTDASQAERLELAVLAAQQLFESAGQSVLELQTLLANAPALTQEAILMGLIRTTQPNAVTVIDPIDQFKSATAQYMAILLKAKSGQPITPDQLHMLSQIIQRAGELQEPLRLQAAWAYLKITHQDAVALATILSP